MANVDHIKVGSTSYDISPSPTGTLTTGTGGFSSSDVAQGSATSWTNVDQMTTADNHATLFTKITQMAKNVRYLYNVLGTGFSTSSTVKSQINSKAPSNHSHSVSQLPTSSTQVNSNDYIPTSALIYSMNQTLTSLNDASIKIKRKNVALSNDSIYDAKYIFYDSEGIFISVSIDSNFNIDNNEYHYPSLYTIRTDDSYIIRSFSITNYDSGGRNVNNLGYGLKIIICYI